MAAGRQIPTICGIDIWQQITIYCRSAGTCGHLFFMLFYSVFFPDSLDSLLTEVYTDCTITDSTVGVVRIGDYGGSLRKERK